MFSINKKNSFVLKIFIPEIINVKENKYEIKPIIFYSIFLILGVNIVNIYFYIISIIFIIFYSLSYLEIKNIAQNFKKIFNI